MVRTYSPEDNSSTEMAQSKSLFISCKTFKNDLTEEAFRRTVDLAFRITGDFKSKKANTAVEIKSKVVDHDPCSDCGSTFFIQTGTCFCCQLCGASAGCS